MPVACPHMLFWNYPVWITTIVRHFTAPNCFVTVIIGHVSAVNGVDVLGKRDRGTLVGVVFVST
jgi:hypothetical protein